MSSTFFPRISIPVFVLSMCLSAILPSLASANTPESLVQERDTLLRLQQLSELEQLSYGDSQQLVEDYRRKADKARADVQQAKRDVEIKQQQHSGLLRGEQTPERLRLLKLSSHALKMSKRGAKSRSRRLLRIEGKLAEAVSSQVRLKSKVAQAGVRVSKQKDKLAKLQKSLEKVPAAVLKPSQVAGAKPEVDSAITKPAAGIRNDKVKIIQTVAVKKPSVERPPVQTVSLDVQAANDAEQEALESANLRLQVKAAAVRESKRAEVALASKDKGRQVHKNLKIEGEGFLEANFEFLGSHQYRAQVKVTHGTQSFIVGSHRYRATIPLSDEGETYVFLYDVNRVGRPRLSMYRKSLLE